MTLALLPLLALLAQPPSAAPPAPPRSPVLQALDLDHDGVISAAEIANAATALRSLDRNGDGRLTPEEYRPPRPDGKPHRTPEAGTAPAKERGLERPRPPLDTILDENGDEMIDAQEIAKAPARLKLLDADGDGRLTPGEYAPKPGPAPEGRTRSRD